MTCAECVAEPCRETRGGGCLVVKIRRMVSLTPRQSPSEEEVCPGPRRAAPGVSLEHKMNHILCPC